ncbi:MAG: Ni/Fe hydrogenase subunit alpha [Phycisphaerae bacterium]
MAKSLDINVHHLTRVEGHGNIVVRASDGKVEKCVLEIVETPRVFESMIEGLRWQDTSLLTCRICGICSVSHTLASIQATDEAFGVELTPEALTMRKLLTAAEVMQSHILHVYFLAAPDAFDAPSVIPLASSHPDVVKRALKLKKLANYICEVLCGRHVHPISLVPGGFTYVPPKKNLVHLKEVLADARADIEATVDTIASVLDKFPAFEREREDVSLVRDDEYAIYNGELKSSKAGQIDHRDYPEFIKEKCVQHSTSKHAYNVDDSFAVGALARFNNNSAQLNELGASAAKAMNLEAPCYNPYLNNAAQVVESAHCYQEAVNCLDELISADLSEKTLAPNVVAKAGRGVGVTEAPRGLLIHDYTYDDNGVCTKANCIIPTGMNLGNIDRDMQKYVPEVIEQRSQDQIEHDLEMLVRAYDPCISCSVHLLKVDWK